MNDNLTLFRASVDAERRKDGLGDEATLTLHASLAAGGKELLLVAGELSQAYSTHNIASKEQIKKVKRWLATMADDLAEYERQRSSP